MAPESIVIGDDGHAEQSQLRSVPRWWRGGCRARWRKIDDRPGEKEWNEPAAGAPKTPRTTSHSEKMAPVRTTRLLAHTLAIMISGGDSGMTNRCSTVPCSRSLSSAAAGRMMESMVIMLTSIMSPMNQVFWRFGL